MSTEEEGKDNFVQRAAAADGGKGLALAEYDPDDPDEMKLLYGALKEDNPHAQRRLKALIRTKRQQQADDKIPLKTSILADGVKEKLSLAVFYVVDSKKIPIGTGYFVDPRVAISAAHTFPESVKVGTTRTGYFGKPHNGKSCQLVVNFIDRENDFIIFGLQIGADDAPAYLEPSPVGLEIGDECILVAYQIGIHEELPELGKEPSVGVFQGAVVKAHDHHFVYSAASFAGDSGGAIILRGGQAAGMHTMTVNQAKQLREHKELEEETATSADIVQHGHSVEQSVASLIESLNSGSLGISVSFILAAYQSDQDSKRKAK